jgi:hypothetical protein
METHASPQIGHGFLLIVLRVLAVALAHSMFMLICMYICISSSLYIYIYIYIYILRVPSAARPGPRVKMLLASLHSRVRVWERDTMAL